MGDAGFEASFITDDGREVSLEQPNSEALLKLLDDSDAPEADVALAKTREPDDGASEGAADPAPFSPPTSALLAAAARAGGAEVEADLATRVGDAPPGILPPIPGMVRTNPEARFEDDLNAMLLQFRNSAMQSWAVAEADLRTKYKSVMDADELAAQARLAASEAVVAELRRKTEDLERAVEAKRQQGKRILFLASRVRADEHSHYLLDRVFQQWNYFMDISQNDKVKDSMASAWRMRRIVGSTFGFWRGKTSIQASARALASIRAESTAEAAQLIAQSELERKREADEIASLNRQLEEEVASKKRLQEDLKSVFMRGVCTLNFEAMQLLSGMPAGVPDLDAEIGNSGPAGVPEPPADTVQPQVVEAEPETEAPAELKRTPEPAAAELPPAVSYDFAAADRTAAPAAAPSPRRFKEVDITPEKAERAPSARAPFKEPVAGQNPRVVDASEAVRWQSAAGASIPVMSVIRPERKMRPKS